MGNDNIEQAIIRIRSIIPILVITCLVLTARSQNYFDAKKDIWLNKAETLMPELIEKDISPVSVVEIIKDSNAYQGWRAKPVADADSVFRGSFKKTNNIILDFGDHYTGYFSFELEEIHKTADAPVRFRFTFGEVPSEMVTPFDPYTGTLSRAWLQDETVTVMEFPALVTLKRRVSFRYLKIELQGSSQYFDFRFTNMKLRSLTSAKTTPEPLNEDTPQIIRKIDQIGQKTLQECMQTVYEDGPKRDRRLWVGDMYLESLSNYYTFKNYDLTKRCLYLLAGLTDSNGYVIATAFEKPEPHPQEGQYLLDYSLLYNVALKDYVIAANDMKTAEDLFTVAKRQLSIIDKYVQANGLFDFEKANKEWWIFIDWKNGLHKQAAIQGLIIYALKQTYELATLLGKKNELEHVPELIEKMSLASIEHFYNTKTKLFESGEEQQVSYASQIWMVLSGVLNKKESQNTLNALISDNNALFPGGPYMYHFFIQALINTEMFTEAKEHLTDYWGGMVDKGADTFWEVYDPANDFISPYNFFPINSYCHAWSCTPVYFIRKYPEIFQK